MHVLKKGRKRNESHVERRHEGGVIHAVSSPGKEDDERERRRWRGKLGIKGSLRAASSVLTLSPGRLVDISRRTRVVARPGPTRNTRTRTYTHTLNDEKQIKKRGELERKY